MGNAALRRLTFPTPLERIASGLFLAAVVCLWAALAAPFMLVKGLCAPATDGQRVRP